MQENKRVRDLGNWEAIVKGKENHGKRVEMKWKKVDNEETDEKKWLTRKEDKKKDKKIR